MTLGAIWHWKADIIQQGHKRTFVLVAILILFILLVSCDKELTPEEKAHYEIPKAALQETSPAFDILAVLMGGYTKPPVGFVGKIWIRAKVKNNTKYTFKLKPALFISIRNCKIIEDKFGNPWLPEKGVGLMDPSFRLSYWEPGETIVVTGEIDPFGRKSSHINCPNYEWAFFEYLTKTLKLVPNEPVQLDQFVTTFYERGGPFPVDCFRPNCPYKILPKDDPLYCGQKERK